MCQHNRRRISVSPFFLLVFRACREGVKVFKWQTGQLARDCCCRTYLGLLSLHVWTCLASCLHMSGLVWPFVFIRLDLSGLLSLHAWPCLALSGLVWPLVFTCLALSGLLSVHVLCLTFSFCTHRLAPTRTNTHTHTPLCCTQHLFSM